MDAPFTTQQFLVLFREYNQAIWPLQIAAYLMAAAALGSGLRPRRGTRVVPPLVLALFWIWIGAAYHIRHFRAINPAAVAFGVPFVVQGALFLWCGVIRLGLDLRLRPGLAGSMGTLLVAYALVLYPMLGHALGHRLPAVPSFGVTPCPTVIFTFGLLLWADQKLPGYLLVIPSLWLSRPFGEAESAPVSVAAGRFSLGRHDAGP
jgi:uncharacterized protein DUF6064